MNRWPPNIPGTPEADNALTSIKNIYVRNDNVDGYLAFVTGLGQDIYPQGTGFTFLYSSRDGLHEG